MAERCDGCGRPLDRPTSRYCPRLAEHPAPDLAWRIVLAFEDDFTDRRGLRQEWDQIDDDIQDEIYDAWVEIVRTELAKP